MIRISLEPLSGSGLKFLSTGHADYGDYGTDVICAGVSALVVNLANSIEQLTDDEVQVRDRSGRVEIRITGPVSDKTRLLIESALLGLNEIRKEYGDDYIQINQRWC